MPVYAYVFSLDLYASPSTSRRRDDLFPPNSHRYHAFQQARGQRSHTQLAARNSAQPRPALPQASATQAEKTPAEGGQVFG
jgi:hypothetical protein